MPILKLVMFRSMSILQRRDCLLVCLDLFGRFSDHALHGAVLLQSHSLAL